MVFFKKLSCFLFLNLIVILFYFILVRNEIEEVKSLREFDFINFD